VFKYGDQVQLKNGRCFGNGESWATIMYHSGKGYALSYGDRDGSWVEGRHLELVDEEKRMNPKDKVALTKLAIGLLPATGVLWGAAACADGAAKYGAYNWRAEKISYTVYLDAMLRHIYCLLDGENYAKDSGKHHLGHIIATASILADAIENDCIIEDRPLVGRAPEIMELYHDKI